VTYRDAVAGDFRQCATCHRKVIKPKRKCSACKSTKSYTVVTANPRNKGRNARGTCLHKPDKVRTKRAKRQNKDSRTGNVPQLRKSNWEFS
jgi:hypothetical protein